MPVGGNPKPRHVQRTVNSRTAIVQAVEIHKYMGSNLFIDNAQKNPSSVNAKMLSKLSW